MEPAFENETKIGGILMKKITAVILVLAFLVASVPVFAGTENDVDIAGDIIFARPLGIITGSVPKTTETLLTNPIKYTFGRPVGDFDYELVSNQTDENKQ
jgi:hypothetical protein